MHTGVQLCVYLFVARPGNQEAQTRQTLTNRGNPNFLPLSRFVVSGNLPEGTTTVDGLYQSRMQELAESVVDLGKSSSVACDWNLDLYADQADDVMPAGSGGVIAPGAGGGGGAGTEGGDNVPRASPARQEFRVEVGEFVALPTPPGAKESLSVGKVMSIVEGDGSDELQLHWYMPVRTAPNCRRSQYGKGRWTEEFLQEGGKLVFRPHRPGEITFSRLEVRCREHIAGGTRGRGRRGGK